MTINTFVYVAECALPDQLGQAHLLRQQYRDRCIAQLSLDARQGAVVLVLAEHRHAADQLLRLLLPLYVSSGDVIVALRQ